MRRLTGGLAQELEMVSREAGHGKGYCCDKSGFHDHTETSFSVSQR